MFAEDLDISVFTIPTGASAEDRRSLLRLQKLARKIFGSYGYLEIGSELGGSLLPHLLDPNCAFAVSIDLRTSRMPDERGTYFDYPENNEALMIAELKRRTGVFQFEKLSIQRKDSSEVGLAEIRGRCQLALIDAEHTNTACFSDAVSTLRLLEDNSIIAFHDANLISDAIQNFERMLGYIGRTFETVFLADCVAAIGLGTLAKDVSSRIFFDFVRSGGIHSKSES